MTTIFVKACPFCGATPNAQRWHGGGPQKTLIGCENDICHASPSVTGATAAEAERRWNARARSAIVLSIQVQPRAKAAAK